MFCLTTLIWNKRHRSNNMLTNSQRVIFSKFSEIDVKLVLTDIYDNWPRIRQTLKKAQNARLAGKQTRPLANDKKNLTDNTHFNRLRIFSDPPIFIGIERSKMAELNRRVSEVGSGDSKAKKCSFAYCFLILYYIVIRAHSQG